MASLSDDLLKKTIDSMLLKDITSCLRKVGVTISAGDNKPRLAARLFTAVRMGLPAIDTQEEEDRRVMLQKAKKLELTVCGTVLKLPHPMLIPEGEWQLSHANFPELLDGDVRSFFKAQNDALDVPTEGKKGLKEGKALWLGNHVYNVRYHHIDNNIDVCFIVAEVVPHTSLNESPYLTWVMLNKKDGTIRTADCHCISGVSEFCKHIAGLLFYIAHIIRTGANVAVTSQLQKWHTPSAKSKELSKAAFINEIDFSKVTSQSHAPVEDQLFQHERRNAFDPRSAKHRKPKTISDMKLDKLGLATGNSAGILLYYRDRSEDEKGPDLNLLHHDEIVETTEHSHMLVPTVAEVFERLKSSKSVIIGKDLLLSLCCTAESAKLLSEHTGQLTEIWKAYRFGRVTASRVALVVKHVDSKGNLTGQLKSVVAGVMGYYKSASGKAISHGNDNEKPTRLLYARLMKKSRYEKHAAFTCKETGVWISPVYPCLAASPDGLVFCFCCGYGTLEIKHPWCNRHLSILLLAAERTSHLLRREGKTQMVDYLDNLQIDNDYQTEIGVKYGVMIDVSHTYFAQSQLQMFCTERDYTDLVTRTMAKKDFISIVRLRRHEGFISALIVRATNFWLKAIVPELISEQYKTEIEAMYAEKEREEEEKKVQKQKQSSAAEHDESRDSESQDSENRDSESRDSSSAEEDDDIMDISAEDDVVSLSSGEELEEEEDVVDEIVCVGPHSIKLSKLECLLSQGKEGEMNDLVMDVAIWLVGKSRPDVMVFPSLAMGVAYQSGIGAAANLLPKDDLSGYSLLLLPCNVPGDPGHWFLLAVQPRRSAVLLLDPMKPDQSVLDRGKHFFGLWRAMLDARLLKINIPAHKWTFHPLSMNSQEDDFNCGVMVIMVSYAVLRNERLFKYAAEHCDSARNAIYDSVVLNDDGESLNSFLDSFK